MGHCDANFELLLGLGIATDALIQFDSNSQINDVIQSDVN